MPGTDERLETGPLSLSAKVTLCLFDLFFLDFGNRALIGLSDISGVIERSLVNEHGESFY